ncbi:MAG: 2-dehydropantoate 2-reductase [Thermodesulfobacteriota bacterium]
MKKKIVIFGAGAVGGYTGGQMARAGEDILLIDPWPEHIDAIKRTGLHLKTTDEEHTVKVPAMHLHEVQSLAKNPVDIVFISTKSYDTEWAAAMMKQYLKPDGFIVSLQNSINEERIAAIVGWGKTVGCIASGISVELYKPGHIKRTLMPAAKGKLVFRVGEVHGRITGRVKRLAEMLSAVDGAKATNNLWGERWTKLVVNSMNNAVSAITGLNSKLIVDQEGPRMLSIKLGAEAVQVGVALGFDLEVIRGMTVEMLLAAGRGEPAALAEIHAKLLETTKHRTEEGRPSTAQDIRKGRRTETDYINGLVAQKGKEVGLATPANEAITRLIRRIESGELKPSPEHADRILGSR